MRHINFVTPAAVVLTLLACSLPHTRVEAIDSDLPPDERLITILATNDKDLFQLVGPRVHVYSRRSPGLTVRTAIAGVKVRFAE